MLWVSPSQTFLSESRHGVTIRVRDVKDFDREFPELCELASDLQSTFDTVNTSEMTPNTLTPEHLC